MRKLSALFGILLLATVPSHLLAKERRGADSIIVKKSAQTVRGELIAVKDHSILVLDSVTKSDISVEISDMVSLSVKFANKKSPWPTATLGFLALGGLGALVGREIGDNGSWIDFSGTFMIYGAAIGGIVGGGGGYLLAKKKRQEVYTFQGKSPEEILTILARLRTVARIPGYR